ncbi:ABC transporter ATP-binding protein [Kitasatospora sp. Ki12]|uniref:ABC transporter ATP-binding protein n=1 Tax=Kitasatospora xanthocidica TaxID=83382 RepID=UPI0016778E70|nr:ABC transporter ATP-binding protein [Kitasatospora xanthocidica]GHF66435.1 ABC transporter ATP-binding protein [Kitasatospora xanthocidica]
MTDEPPVVIRRLSYRIGDRRLLDEAELSVAAGESVAVMGPSGTGKSTLLALLVGLDKPFAGEIRVAGQDVPRLGGARLAAFRRDRVGMVFQFGELLPELEPVENVALAGLLAGRSRRDALAEARALLAEVGLPVRPGVTTAALSGGERQRTAIARALMGAPPVLLADEPTGSLDGPARDRITRLLFDLPRSRGCALVVVTHDSAVAAAADRTVLLRAGKLVEEPALIGGAR